LGARITTSFRLDGLLPGLVDQLVAVRRLMSDAKSMHAGTRRAASSVIVHRAAFDVPRTQAGKSSREASRSSIPVRFVDRRQPGFA
jgi:hypothetical protein